MTTNHGPFTARTRRLFADIARHAPIVAISRSHARTAGVPIAAVIHHGIDLQAHRPGPGDGGYLLFVGRMCADKGVHHAVRVARRAGQPLVIVARIREPAERVYFEEQVRPLLRPGDDLSAEVSLAAKMELMRHAVAQLNPITWAEPFGGVMAEALAAGTPVLAFPNGAPPEIVDDGQTGYLCHGELEMIAAVGRVPQIDRDRCRAAAEQRFSAERMVADYERLYRRIVLSPGGFADPGACGRASAAERLTAPVVR